MKCFAQVLCWEYYNKPKNLVAIEFIKYHNFEFKNWKKLLKNVRIRSFFYILTNDNNYELTNGIQLEFFAQALCWEYYSKPKKIVSSLQIS